MTTPRNPELTIMACAFTEAMGRTFNANGGAGAQIGDWYLERADSDKSLWKLAERCEHHSIRHPITSQPLPAQALADALYFARLAIGLERDERRHGRI